MARRSPAAPAGRVDARVVHESVDVAAGQVAGDVGPDGRGLEAGADRHLAAERDYALEDAGACRAADRDVDQQRVVRIDRHAADAAAAEFPAVDLLEEVAALIEGGEHLALVGAGVDDLVVARREVGRADDPALLRQGPAARHLGEDAGAGGRRVDPVGAQQQFVKELVRSVVEDLVRVLRQDGQVAGVVRVSQVRRRQVDEAALDAALDGAFGLESH